MKIKIKSKIIKLLKKYLIYRDETKIQFLNKQETFKPLSARTHNEIVKSTQKIEKLLSESKQIPKNNSSPINTNIQKQKYILPKPNLLKKKELIPRLNLSSLKNHNEEVKFFTPREKNINLNY